MDKPASVMLVDDHPLFRKGLKEVIAKRSGYSVIAEADNGESAITLSRIHKPDVIIIDLALPGRNGLEVIKFLKRGGSNSMFIVMTLYNDENLIEESLKLGACAYLMKTDGLDVLDDCLNQLAENKIYVSPRVSAIPSQKPGAILEPINWAVSLSNREKMVLKGIANNKTSKEIAESLSLSTRTVQNHRARIIKKLGLQGANSLYRFALENASHYRV